MTPFICLHASQFSENLGTPDIFVINCYGKLQQLVRWNATASSTCASSENLEENASLRHETFSRQLFRVALKCSKNGTAHLN